jgi:hypothetical protein
MADFVEHGGHASEAGFDASKLPRLPDGPGPGVAAQEAVLVRPGDTLAVRVHPHTTPEQGKRLLDELRALWPDGEVKGVVVAAEQILVYRPDGDDV